MRTLLAAGLTLLFAAPAGALTLESAAFASGGSIPQEYTCQGIDVSPALAWSGVPSDAKTLVLIVEDPDVPDPAAPVRSWTHWVLYDIPAGSLGLPRDVAFEQLQGGTRQGKNDWGRAGWGGPCPPIGRHRYMFTLYAVSERFPDLGLATAGELATAMQGHVSAKSELIGTYEKTK